MKSQIHLQLSVKMLFILLTLLSTIGIAYQQSVTEEPGTFRNPLNVNNGADPWLTYYDGNYYLAATTWASAWTMRKSPTLAGLKTAEPVQIYYETEPTRCCSFWAPEFHLLDGPDGLRWYFYYTAGTADTYDNQRSYVLESADTDPMGPYTFKSQIVDPENDVWSIDGSVMQLDDQLHFLSSAFVNGLQSLVIAPMSNPWTLSGHRTLLSKPEFAWETMGGWVNEGPVALQHDDKTFIVYSASSCATGNYKLGMLTYNGGDPLSIASWDKNPEPVFQRSDANGVYGPGHNGFFRSPDSTEDWIVYHAVDFSEGACSGLRTTRVQKIDWNTDGTPNFGVPVSTDEVIPAPSGDMGIDPVPEFPPRAIARFESFALPGNYLRHISFRLALGTATNPAEDSQFAVVPGLADPAAVSFESVNFPGFYMRQQSNVIVLTPDDNTETFAGDATWWLRPGLADSSWTSLESYNHPSSYIGKKFGIMALVEVTSATPDRAREDATFRQEPLS